MNIVITGANGFIGRHLCQHFHKADYHVLAITRRPCDIPDVEHKIITDFENFAAWRAALDGADAIIHLSGIAHTRRPQYTDYWRANVVHTSTIAKAAVEAGVKQFIFLSTIKVNGEFTQSRPFSSHDTPNPEGHYATTKWHAEMALEDLSRSGALSTTVIRPPLVYGDTPKGNLNTIIAALRMGLPLPLGNTMNKRDFSSLENLTNLIQCCLLNPATYNKTLLLSDGAPISTTTLIREIARREGVPARLIPCPAFLQSLATKAPILSRAGKKLFGNLEVSISETEKITGWKPLPNSDK